MVNRAIGVACTDWLTSGHPYDIVVGGDHGIWFSEPTANKIGTFGWDLTDYTRQDDPIDQTLVPISQGPAGQTTVSPNLGKAVISVPLDFELGDVTVPDCGCVNDAWATLLAQPTMQPELVYNSNTIAPQPLVEVTLKSPAGGSVPTSISGILTWNNGTPQSAVSFSCTGHSAGDTYDLAFQVNSAVASTGYYPYEVDLTITLPGDTITRSITGALAVVVNGSSDPFGEGWSVGSVDSLVPVSGGVVWVYGTGGARYFAGTSGTLLSPPNDFGTMALVGSNYIYTAKDQTKWYFDSTSGLLDKIVDSDNLTRTYAYASGRPVTITEPSGALTTFSYDGNSKLSQVQEPGGRTVTVSVNGTTVDLTNVTYADGSARAFT